MFFRPRVISEVAVAVVAVVAVEAAYSQHRLLINTSTHVTTVEN
jgi:hypothetical protein